MADEKAATRTAKRNTPKAKPKGKSRGKKLQKPAVSTKTREQIILELLTDEQKQAMFAQFKLREMFGFFKSDIVELGIKVGKVIILDDDGVLHNPDSYNVEDEEEDDEEDEEDDEEDDGDIDDDEDDLTTRLELWMDEYNKSQQWVAKRLKVTQGCVSAWLREEDATYPRNNNAKKLSKLIASAPKKRGRPRKKS